MSTTIYAQDTQGFFLNDWQPKTLTSPAYIDTVQSIGSTNATVSIDFADKVTKVSNYVYGNNGNPYSGKMNTDATLLTYLNDLNPHVLRWPGGNLSQEYFWDKSSRPADIPAAAGFWGGRNSSNQTTDDYYDMLVKTKSTGSICVNIAYARYGTSANPIVTAAHYAANWVRYDKGRSKFWELGNENFGNWEAGYKIDTSLSKDHQPQIINGKLYGKICRVVIDSMRAAAAELGIEIKIGAVAMEQLVTWDSTQQGWNAGMMAQLADKADFYIVHSYYTPYNENSTVETILNSPSHTKEYVDYITSGLASVGHGPMPVALTEWNIFAIGSKQSVSYINGMHSAINLGELIKNKYGMSCKWDLSNGWSDGDDHGMFASSSELDVKFRTPHPQFHYMYYFQKYFGDQMVKSNVIGNSKIISYASSFKSGQCGIVLANKSTQEQKLEIKISNFKPGKHYYLFTLTGGNDNGDFSRKVYINGQGTTDVAGGPVNYATLKPYGIATDDKIKVSMPPLSIVYAVIDPNNIPDIEWARVDNANTVKIKLTNAVVIPDTLKGLKVILNGSEIDSITKIKSDITDSTLLLISVNKSIQNTDRVSVSYKNGNLKTWDKIALVESAGIRVENILAGSSPVIKEVVSNQTGSEIYIYFNKKMNAGLVGSFKLSITNLNNQEIKVNTISFNNGDSGIYKLTLKDPVYLDYNMRLAYTGSGITSVDGGQLSANNPLIIRNYAPYKPSVVKEAYINLGGDSIILVFDKKLISSSILKNSFTVSIDNIDAALKSVMVNSKAINNLVLKPQTKIDKGITNIKVSYSGSVLLSTDSAAVLKFDNQIVENRSVVTDIYNFENLHFDIYPNPAKDLLNIRAGFKYDEIEITDITGKSVFSKVNSQGFSESTSIGLQLIKGMYFIELRGKNMQSTAKFIVN